MIKRYIPPGQVTILMEGERIIDSPDDALLIFSLESIDDLPKDVKRELRLLGVRDDTQKLIDLFEKKNRLSIDEIIVALYRLHKMEKTRVWVSSTMYNLYRRGLFKMVKGKKGEYEKVTNMGRYIRPVVHFVSNDNPRTINVEIGGNMKEKCFWTFYKDGHPETIVFIAGCDSGSWGIKEHIFNKIKDGSSFSCYGCGKPISIENGKEIDEFQDKIDLFHRYPYYGVCLHKSELE